MFTEGTRITICYESSHTLLMNEQTCLLKEYSCIQTQMPFMFMLTDN